MVFSKRTRNLTRFERLECRTLLACSVAVTGSVIEVTGTDSVDYVKIENSQWSAPGPGQTVDILLNCAGDVGSYSGTYNKIHFFGKGSRDVFNNQSALSSWVQGGPGDDWLQGGSGYDRLEGGDGWDWVNGGLGNDVLFGGPDPDEMFGDAGNDRVIGDSGRDEIHGGPGIDWLYGNDGDDMLHGGDDVDVLFGGADNDSLYGDGSNDYLFGEQGNDGLYGGLMFDRMQGGPGADRFLMESEAPDQLYDLNEEIDAVIYFFNGSGSKTKEGGRYDPGSWTPEEIERVDAALKVVHRVAGDTHLLKNKPLAGQVVGSPVTFIRYGAFSGSGPSYPAWNLNGNVWFTDGAFNNGVNVNGVFTHLLDHYVYHEIGHTFYDPAFDKLSHWIPWNLNFLPPGFVWASPAEGPPKYIYHQSATFAEEYGKANPHEDFATAFAALFVDAAGQSFLTGPGAWAIPEKIQWLYKNIVD